MYGAERQGGVEGKREDIAHEHGEEHAANGRGDTHGEDKEDAVFLYLVDAEGKDHTEEEGDEKSCIDILAYDTSV